MRVEDITIEVRTVSLTRVGQIDFGEITNTFKAHKRFNNVGSWEMSLPADYDMAQALAQPGAGITVLYSYLTDPTFSLVGGEFVENPRTLVTKTLLSGPVVSFTNTQSVNEPYGVYKFLGLDDNVVLGDAAAFPQPAVADPAMQMVAYDVRTGNAETIMRQYVDLNIGPSAPSARRISNVSLETNGNRGKNATGRARFTQLGALLSELASAGGVGFEVLQSGSSRQFRVYSPQDKTGIVRMDIANDTMESTEHGLSAPTATRAIVAGQGQGDQRTFLQVTSAAATAAEVAWGRKIEIFKDQRNTNDPVELLQSGQEIVDSGGSTITSISVKPSDSDTMRFVQDWYIGDKVTAVIDGQETQAIVTEAVLVIDSDGARAAATVGEPAGFDFESRIQKRQNDQERRIANLERNADSGGGSTIDPANAPGSVVLRPQAGPLIQSIPNAAWTRVNVTTLVAVIQDSTTFTRTTNGFTIQKTGYYTLSAEGVFEANTGGQRRVIGFFFDGVEAKGERGITTNGYPSFTVPLGTSMDFYIEAGTLIELGFYQNSGVALDATVLRVNARYHGPM